MKGIELTHFNMVSNLAQLCEAEDKVNYESVFTGNLVSYNL